MPRHWHWDEDLPDNEEDYQIDGVGFADPGGESALRAATKDNPRDQPCPTCHWPNRLTRIDVQRHYQCDACANAAETGQDINYYEGEDVEEDDLPVLDGWNLDQLLTLLQKVGAEVGEDNEGQIIIYTGYKEDDDGYLARIKED